MKMLIFLLSLSLGLLIASLLVGCGIPRGYEVRQPTESGYQPRNTAKDSYSNRNNCCCARLEEDGLDLDLFMWICENPPFERGQCFPMKKNKCGKKRR